MKAALIHENGPPEALKYEDIDPLPVGPNDAMIKVRATSVNWFDVMGRSGEYSAFKNFPHILGGDIAGEVVEVGSEVTNAKPGDRVLVYATVACGQCEYCGLGQPNICQNYKYYGSGAWGGYAQYFTGRAANLIQLDDSLDFGECASVNIAFLTAWHMLQRANIRAGEDILIQAAASGVGSGAVQMAKLAGLRVIGTASSEEKCQWARDLGADHMINYKTQNFREEVRQLTGGRGVDVVVEHVGADVWEESIRSLTRMGRLVTCGASSGMQVTANVAHIFHKQLTIIGSNHGTMNELKTIIKLLKEGKLKAVIGHRLPLSEAAESHRLLENRGTLGKIVLEPEHDD